MNTLELRVILSAALQIHLPEFVECGLFGNSTSSGCLNLKGSSQLPASFISVETIDLAILSLDHQHEPQG